MGKYYIYCIGYMAVGIVHIVSLVSIEHTAKQDLYFDVSSFSREWVSIFILLL